jgi:tRNA G18 (ribose-2'-O)-methylase SpoU
MPPRQLQHEDHVADTRRSALRLLLDDISDPLNVGSIFRIADAMAIDRLYLCGDTSCPPDKTLHRTARSSERHVPFEHHQDAAALADQLKDESVMLIALEITDSSIDIGSDEFGSLFEKSLTSSRVPCLILGSESTGISQPLLDRAELCVHIPMLGRNSSMNVAAATAIACFELNRLLFKRLNC